MNHEIKLNDVSKVFKTGLFRKKLAVDQLSLTVPKGQIVGLLGPNGSGKSTTIKMILGFLRPTSGTISVCGHSPQDREARRFIGYLPENPRFQKFLTAKDVLFYYGRLLSMAEEDLQKRVDYLLDLVNLRHAENERTQGFSKGMIQRLAVAQSLLAKPPLLIFDEPMSGLDPLGRIDIRDIMRTIHDEMPSTTLFFSTHVLSDAEQLCHSAVLLKKGKLERNCPIDELISEGQENFDVIFKGLDAGKLDRYQGRLKHSAIGDIVTVGGSAELMAEIDFLRDNKADVVSVTSHRQSLEEVLFGDKEAHQNAPEVRP